MSLNPLQIITDNKYLYILYTSHRTQVEIRSRKVLHTNTKKYFEFLSKKTFNSNANSP